MKFGRNCIVTLPSIVGRLGNEGIFPVQLCLPPFCFSINTVSPLVLDNLRRLYPADAFAGSCLPDYALQLLPGEGIHRWYHRQARFLCDGREPFTPLPAAHGYAMLEWGMNWTIASQEFSHVIVHAGVLAFGDRAVMLPAPPGSGKSTLTLWLAFHGWRLLSDEMGLLTPNSLEVLPFVRPICLKNRSITLAKQWFPDAVFSTLCRDTHKGDVIHVSPPELSWREKSTPAQLQAIVFPKYQAGSPLQITRLNQAQAFMELANNAFNMSLLGQLGFESALRLIEQLPVYQIQYHDLAEVEQFLREVVDAV